MSKTRTVSITSNQNGQREGEQVVNWGRDQSGTKRSHFIGANGNPLSFGYRLGGGDRSEADGASAIATDTNKTDKMQRPNKRARPEGTGGRTGGDAMENRAQTTGLGLERNKPAIPIEEFYAEKGVDYKRLRKCSKVKYPTNPTGSKHGPKIIKDYFTLPKGYTQADLPDSQGSNMSMEEQPVSPAVVLASQFRRKGRMNKESPKMKCDELLQRLNSRQNRKENKSKSSPAVNYQEGPSSKKSETETAANPASLSLNGSFPEDSFNDSELVLASQQMEDALNQDALNQESSVNEIRKRDINGNAKRMGNNTSAAESNMPFATSTPKPCTSRNLSDENTPRTRNAGLPRKRNKNSTQKSNSSSIFENSTAGVDLISPVKDESDLMETGSGGGPKILKFGESPIKFVNKKNSQWGTFFDDDDDHLFSQVDMPEGNIENKQNGNSDKSTLLLGPTQRDDTMDSMDESDLAALLQLELNCRSASTSGNSSSSLISAATPSSASGNRPIRNTNTVQPVISQSQTCLTPARRQGLSRRKRK